MKHTIEIDYEFTSKAVLKSDGSLSFSLTVAVPRTGGEGAPIGFTEHSISEELAAKVKAALNEAAEASLQKALGQALKAAATSTTAAAVAV